MQSYLIILACVIALSIGQILFKVASGKIDNITDLMTRPAPAAILMLAIAIYGASTLGWIAALRSVPLSRAYMFMAAGFIIVPVVSHFLFNEPLTARFLLGAMMVAVGIVVAVS